MVEHSKDTKITLSQLLIVTELAELIVSGLDSKADLPNLRLVSRRFDTLARPLVYQSLHLDFAWQEFLRTVQIVEFLNSKPNYLSLIQDLSVSFGSKAFNGDSKEFNHRCLIVIQFIPRLPNLLCFKWQAKDTIHPQILGALTAHPNTPILELRQEKYGYFQSFPPFRMLTQMHALRSFRLYLNLDAAAAMWLYELISGSFELINAHMQQLEELDISISGSFELPTFGDRIGPDLTQDMIRNAGNLSQLKILSIKSDNFLLSRLAGQPTGLYCIFHYSFPALQSLLLDFPGFPGTDLFWKELADAPRSLKPLRLKHLQHRLPLGDGDHNSLECFLQSFTCLEKLELTGAGTNSVWADETLRKAVFHHQETLTSLTILPFSIARLQTPQRDGAPSAENVLASFPHLQELGLDFDPHQHMGGLLELKAVPIRVLHLYMDRPSSGLTARIGESDIGMLRTKIPAIMSECNQIEKIFVYQRPGYTEISTGLGGLMLSVRRNGETGEFVWQDYRREVEERELKRWAKELGQKYLEVENDHDARMRYRGELELAKFPAYQEAIDALANF